MKKNHGVRFLLIVVLLVMTFGTLTVSASAIPYATYTYGRSGFMLECPAAYVPVPESLIDGKSLQYSVSAEGGASANAKLLYAAEFTNADGSAKGLSSPSDVFVDDLNHVYISDTGNNRIIVTDEKYNVRLVISEFLNNYGVPDGLSQPNGLFVTESEIYVADKGNSRIVIFDKLERPLSAAE